MIAVTTSKTDDPEICQETRWCDQRVNHRLPHSREIGSTAVRGEHVLAVREVGFTKTQRDVELQVDGAVVKLDADAIKFITKTLGATKLGAALARR